jgi:hypothetical protein
MGNLRAMPKLKKEKEENKMNKVLMSLVVVAVAVAFVAAVPAAQAWQEHGKITGEQAYGEHETLSKASGPSTPVTGQFESQSEFMGKGRALPIYYRDKFPDEIPL